MACPTCNHSMHRISVERPDAPEMGTFWCPRCGTLKSGSEGHWEIDTPMLIHRCQEFQATLGPHWQTLWHKLGIKDAICLPHERIESK